jgi:hypothetical protein
MQNNKQFFHQKHNLLRELLYVTIRVVPEVEISKFTITHTSTTITLLCTAKLIDTVARKKHTLLITTTVYFQLQHVSASTSIFRVNNLLKYVLA